jgi:hypothetical protein
MPIKMAEVAFALALMLAKKFSSFKCKGKLGSMVTTSILSKLLHLVFVEKNAKMWVILP